MSDKDRSPNPSTPDVADDTTRKDASGFDVTPPPGADKGRSDNPGLHDEEGVGGDGWRVSDTNRDADWTEWRGSEPYPGSGEGPDARAEARADAVTPDVAEEAGGDLLERVTTLLTDDLTLDVTDISVEVQGGRVILRGSAGSRDARERAADIAMSIPGVTDVENLIAAN